MAEILFALAVLFNVFVIYRILDTQNAKIKDLEEKLYDIKQNCKYS